MSDLCKEARAAGPGEREGASLLAGKVSSALCAIEIGTEQITSRASCSGGAGAVHLRKTQRVRVGDREGKVLPPIYRESQRTGFSCSVPISPGPEM